MRQLHTVAFHEKFAASGTYIYEQNGRPAGISESWTIHNLPDQSQRVRVDHDERSTSSGTTILLEALRDNQGVIQRFDIRLDNPNGKFVKQAKASYTLFDDHIQIGRQLNDQPLQDEIIALPPKIVIYPLMHIFIGSVLRQIIERGGVDIPVFIPNIIDPDDNQVLSGIIEPRSASEIESQSGQYHFAAANDDQKAIFWLDQTNLLIAYQYQSMRVTLKNLARSNTFA